VGAEPRSPTTGVARLYAGRFRSRFTGGHNGPQFGRLLDHPILQDVISVAPDRRTAYARYRTLMQAGTHQLGFRRSRRKNPRSLGIMFDVNPSRPLRARTTTR
jgi:hypothetical protein